MVYRKTYGSPMDLICGTQNLGQITGLSDVFKLKNTPVGMMEGQEGLEPSTPCLRGRCSNQLSYWPLDLHQNFIRVPLYMQ